MAAPPLHLSMSSSFSSSLASASASWSPPAPSNTTTSNGSSSSYFSYNKLSFVKRKQRSSPRPDNNSSNSKSSPSPCHSQSTMSPRYPTSTTTSRIMSSSLFMKFLRGVMVASCLVFLGVNVWQSQVLVAHNIQQNFQFRETNRNLLRDRHDWKIPPPRKQRWFDFDAHLFQERLDQWRHQTGRSKLATTSSSTTSKERQRQLSQANAALLLQQQVKEEQLLKIPFWEQQTLFRRRNAWHLMTVIMADDCLPRYNGKNSTTNTDTQYVPFPSLLTLQDALQTTHADIIVFLPQTPNSTLFPQDSHIGRQQQLSCQAKLQATMEQLYLAELQAGKLQVISGMVNPLPPRIKYDYRHRIGPAMEDFKKQFQHQQPTVQQAALSKLQMQYQQQQLLLEINYSLGLDFAYLAELVYQYADLFLFVTSGTRLLQLQPSSPEQDEVEVDYGATIVQQYEQFQQRSAADSLVHRFCYMSFLKQDTWMQLPGPNTTEADLPPRHQSTLDLPTGIVMERHGLYRMSMVLRSLLPYHKESTASLFLRYCTELLWEAQIVQPIGPQAIDKYNEEMAAAAAAAVAQNNQSQSQNQLTANSTTAAATVPILPVVNWDASSFPPALFTDNPSKDHKLLLFDSTSTHLQLPNISPELLQKQHEQIQQQQQVQHERSIPPWVTVDNSQLGPQRNTDPSTVIQTPNNAKNNNNKKRLVTFVVPTATRPNGVKNQYVTYSLNQLFPLIRRDFKDSTTGAFQATVLLVICGNTQDELDDHQKGLWEYYGPEIQEGILEIVATNLDTYPSLHNLPNNYNDPENRLRWRSKQNLDISSSFFAAKGKSEYIMLLEDDTGYRDKFTPTLKAMLLADQRQEKLLAPDPAVSNTGVTAASTIDVSDDYRQHIFAQIHFGFGYSGVLIHDDDALVYAVMHYVLMDEKPCDLLYLANYLQGKVLDQKFRWQLKRVLITHLGSVSSLKGKIQPVWGLKG